MALSCRERQERIEVEILQPVDRFVNQLQERCETEACKWWMLCLNKLVCWLSWVVVKICEWVLMLVFRWVYLIFCVVISLVIGILAVFIGNFDLLGQALIDLVQFIKDAFFFVLGGILYVGSNLIDFILTGLNLQDKKRPLTKEEIALLRTIFGDSIWYPQIRVNEGRIGIYGPPFANKPGATTIGYNIYFRSPVNIVTLVHECVHIWQFQFGGAHYMGQSVVYQSLFSAGLTGSPYFWETMIGIGTNSWYLLESVEAQAEFIEDLFNFGRFIPANDQLDTEEGNGAFFKAGSDGRNEFLFSRDAQGIGSNQGADFTAIANRAWQTIQVG
jgi:hypothetical protein